MLEQTQLYRTFFHATFKARRALQGGNYCHNLKIGGKCLAVYFQPGFIHSNWTASINIYKLTVSIILPVENQHWYHWCLHKTQLVPPILALHILLLCVLAQPPSHQKCHSLLRGAVTALQDSPGWLFSTILSHFMTGTQAHSHSSRGPESSCNHCANPTVPSSHRTQLPSCPRSEECLYTDYS